MKKFKILRMTKRTRDAVNDIDYADKCNEAETEWMEIFLAGHYGNDSDAMVALTGTTDVRSMRRGVNAAGHAHRRDIANQFTKYQFPDDYYMGGVEGDNTTQLPPDALEHYKCARCLKKAGVCVCPDRKYSKAYGVDDYKPAESSPEEAYAEASAALNERAYDLLPYGDAPMDLKPGHKVVICLPHHYLKDRSGTLKELREVDGAWLVVADRPALKGRDEDQVPFTMCYVRPEGLKRASVRLAR